MNNIGFRTINHNINNTEDYRSYSKINYSIWSGQLDFTLPYKFANIETGAKMAYFQNSSDLEYFRIANGNSVLMPDGKNLFEYKEQNYAGYFSIDKKIDEQWSVKAGIRYEYSVIDGFNPVSGEKNKYIITADFFLQHMWLIKLMMKILLQLIIPEGSTDLSSELSILTDGILIHILLRREILI